MADLFFLSGGLCLLHQLAWLIVLETHNKPHHNRGLATWTRFASPCAER